MPNPLSIKKGDMVLIKGYKRVFWIHDYRKGEFRVVDSALDIDDPESKWDLSMWISSNKIKQILINK
jgi:hypothetical protein